MTNTRQNSGLGIIGFLLWLVAFGVTWKYTISGIFTYVSMYVPNFIAYIFIVFWGLWVYVAPILIILCIIMAIVVFIFKPELWQQ